MVLFLKCATRVNKIYLNRFYELNRQNILTTRIPEISGILDRNTEMKNHLSIEGSMGAGGR